ncbi:hypothetical protein DFH06DRAFT_532809 [Mycena polygramma]|nr:hypothetical protein DFH06DRAFT_532809 [Mycena polygramma]
MAPVPEDIFRGVKYRIACSDDVDSFRMLLDTNGAAQETDLKRTTRIIADSSHFAELEKVECKGIMVTPEWVYSSVKAGAKKPAQYYSGDPAMIFSSAVFSAVEQSEATVDILPTLIAKWGGQWLPTVTDEATHLIADPKNNAVDCKGFRPIIVSLRWVVECIRRGKLLPVESPGLATEKDSSSPAQRFCAGLLLEMQGGGELTPTGGPSPYLPFEILAKIFIAFRDLLLESPAPSIGALLTVSHVCSRWRDIALYTGALWTQFVLNFHTKRHYARLHILVQQLEIRSRPYPLSLTIRSCYPREHNPVIDFISAHASRIRDLSLQLPAAHFHHFLRLKGGSFPLLETLTMSVIPKSESVYDPGSGLTRSEYFHDDFFSWGAPDEGVLWKDMAGPISVLKSLPRLRNLTIASGSTQPLDSRMLPVTWSTLTDIDLRSVTLSVFDVAYLLRQCTSIERINFMTDPSMGRSMPPIACVRLPLISLTWQGLFVDDFSIFDPLILHGSRL